MIEQAESLYQAALRRARFTVSEIQGAAPIPATLQGIARYAINETPVGILVRRVDLLNALGGVEQVIERMARQLQADHQLTLQHPDKPSQQIELLELQREGDLVTYLASKRQAVGWPWFYAIVTYDEAQRLFFGTFDHKQGRTFANCNNAAGKWSDRVPPQALLRPQPTRPASKAKTMLIPARTGPLWTQFIERHKPACIEREPVADHDLLLARTRERWMIPAQGVAFDEAVWICRFLTCPNHWRDCQARLAAAGYDLETADK